MEPITLALGLAQILGPRIAGLIAGDKGEAVAGKVLEIAQDLTGLKDPELAVDHIRSDPKAAAEFYKRVQDNEQALRRLAFADKRDARAMYGRRHAMADHIARRVTAWNLPALAALIGVNVAAGYWVEDAALVQVTATLTGAACQHLWQERRTIIEFYFGAGLAGDGSRPDGARGAND